MYLGGGVVTCGKCRRLPVELAVDVWSADDVDAPPVCDDVLLCRPCAAAMTVAEVIAMSEVKGGSVDVAKVG